MAGSPEEPPWGADRKVPPLWGVDLERNWQEVQSSLRPGGREGPGETGKEAYPVQEPWVAILEVRPPAPPSALFNPERYSRIFLPYLCLHPFDTSPLVSRLFGLFT